MAFDPAPGQFVRVADFNDPSRALGSPSSGGISSADNSSVVSLGGFGGSITLGFDHTVEDDPKNSFGMDAIVYGNAFWFGEDPQVHWAEAAMIEISLDTNGNGLADDPWYLIPGSHILDPVGQFSTMTWDDNIADQTYLPTDSSCIPPGRTGVWDTHAYELPVSLFGQLLVENPSSDATKEGVLGYADYSPTLRLGDLNADDVVDDETRLPHEFYTVPDDPRTVGMSCGSGGGDAFDIAWAIDPQTQEPANLPGFDFIRLTTAVHALLDLVGEKSAEIDAVADVAPDPFGDFDGNGGVDLSDYAEFQVCFGVVPVPGSDCERGDWERDGTIDLIDFDAIVCRWARPR